ncbi:hypothetical protein [Vreelandella aquamarina]|uniref:hypothetical protein n=1 Tax=Vreelandella aquamarina TaxID=77097 RepID=UPI0038514A3F
MPIEFKRRSAVLTGACEVEEAETLHGWLLEQPKASLNLRHCEYLHTAVLQVILAAKATANITLDPLPSDSWLARVLQAENSAP